ncbi:MAG: hypothetical protein ACK5V3_06840 [Bdellovibrionales bacterium]
MPRPILVLGAIILGISIFMFLSPPHTICDTAHAEVTGSLIGITRPLKVKKQTHPPKINNALDSCYSGRSSGACYEYFHILKTLAKFVISSNSECRNRIFNISDIKSRLIEGAENLVLLAWGDYPPEDVAVKFGILQDADVALFCYIKGAVIAGSSEQDWQSLRKKLSKKLPGERPKLPENPKDGITPARNAAEVLSELEIWNKSLFSVRCENYL